MYLDTIVCPNIRLADFRSRVITNEAAAQAQKKFEEMQATAELQVWKTSKRWVEDVDKNPEWLVIYASKREKNGETVRDGF